MRFEISRASKITVPKIDVIDDIQKPCRPSSHNVTQAIRVFHDTTIIERKRQIMSGEKLHFFFAKVFVHGSPHAKSIQQYIMLSTKYPHNVYACTENDPRVK